MHLSQPISPEVVRNADVKELHRKLCSMLYRVSLRTVTIFKAAAGSIALEPETLTAALLCQQLSHSRGHDADP